MPNIFTNETIIHGFTFPGYWFLDSMCSLMWITIKDAGALGPLLILYYFIWSQTCRHCRDSSFRSCSDTVPQPSRAGWSFSQGIPWSSRCYWCKSSPQCWHHPGLSPSAPHPRSQTAEGENPVMSPSQGESEPNNAGAELSWDISETQKHGYLTLLSQWNVYNKSTLAEDMFINLWLNISIITYPQNWMLQPRYFSQD